MKKLSYINGEIKKTKKNLKHELSSYMLFEQICAKTTDIY